MDGRGVDELFHDISDQIFQIEMTRLGVTSQLIGAPERLALTEYVDNGIRKEAMEAAAAAYLKHHQSKKTTVI